MKIFTKIIGLIICIGLSCFVATIDTFAYLELTDEDLEQIDFSDEFFISASPEYYNAKDILEFYYVECEVRE